MISQRRAFERNPASQAAVERLMQFAAAKCRGDILTWEELEKISQFSRTELASQNNTANGGYIMKRFSQRMLVERGIQLWPVREAGFEMLTEHDQIFVVTKKRSSRAKRQHKANLRSLMSLSNDKSAKVSDRDGKFAVAQMEILQSNIEQLDTQIHMTDHSSKTETIERPPLMM
jgi:hypothetical protein